MDVCVMYVAYAFRVLARAPLLIEQRTLRNRCHPVAGDALELGFVSSLAMQTLSMEYFGQPYALVILLTSRNLLPPPLRSLTLKARSAHAGYAPWEGVNALDAAFVAYAGISALRQQIRPEQRVHGVISGRDWTPNGSFFSHFFLTPSRFTFITPPSLRERRQKKRGGRQMKTTTITKTNLWCGRTSDKRY